MPLGARLRKRFLVAHVDRRLAHAVPEESTAAIIGDGSYSARDDGHLSSVLLQLVLEGGCNSQRTQGFNLELLADSFKPLFRRTVITRFLGEVSIPALLISK